MSTIITIVNNDQANFPFVFRINGRQFQLNVAGLWWELIEYKADGTHKVMGRWSWKKARERMIAEALSMVLTAVKESTNANDKLD